MRLVRFVLAIPSVLTRSFTRVDKGLKPRSNQMSTTGHRRFAQGRRLLALGSLVILLMLVPVALWQLTAPSRQAEATWFDGSYAYRQLITFGNTGSADSNKKVKFDVDTAALITAGKMQADCDDVRFTDYNGKVLRFYLDSAGGACNTNSTDFYVLMETIYAGTTHVLMYYGNPSANFAGENAQFSESTFSPTSGPTFGTEATTPGPVAEWKFDEGQGQTVQDSTTNNNDGTLGASSGSSSDDPTWKTEGECVSGKCLSFDGGDYAKISNPTVLNFSGTTSFSISTWFKVKDPSTTQRLVARYSNGAQWALGISASKVNLLREVSPYTIVGNTTIQANKWYHVEATYNGSQARIYLNGIQDATPVTLGSVASSTSDVYFGARNTGLSDFYTGYLDEVKIFAYARTASQVQADYNLGATRIGDNLVKANLTKGLVGYWRMDDAGVDTEGELLTDTSGNGNSAMLIGDNGSGDNGSGMDCTAAGKFGTACNFDGTDDYVTLNSFQNIPSSGQSVTISAWINPTSVSGVKAIMGRVNGSVYGYGLTTSGTSVNLSLRGSAVFDCGGPTGVVVANTWTHVAGTIQDSSAGTIASIYVNGALVKTCTSSDRIATGSSFLIGARGSPPATFFSGKIDDARVYNRRLTAAEVELLANEGNGPVGYWKMDENTGTTANDTSINANNLTLTNTPTWVPGKFGSGVNLAGSDQHLLRADDDDFDFADGADVTFSAFFRHATASAQEIILSKYNEAGYKIIMESDGDITCALDYDSTWTPTDSVTSTAATYDDNLWHYVSCVKTGASSLKLYIDGTLIGTDSSLAVANALTNSDPLYLGIDADGTSNDFIGQIDEVKIYTYARSAQQIVEDLNAGHPVGGSPIGSQTAYWAFDDLNGATATNRIMANSSITGTLSGASWLSQESCKVNGCLNFDGVDDVTTMTNTSAIDLNEGLGGGFTTTAWVYVDSDGEADTGQIWQKGTNSYLRVDTETGGRVDLEGKLDLATTDATLNIASALAINSWNHVALTYSDDSDDEIQLYVNGILRGTSTNGVGSPAAESNNLLVGGTTTANFDGRIDEFKIYTGRLTADQVQIDMNGGATQNVGVTAASEASILADGAGSAPIGYWNLDDNTGSTAKDISGNGNTGTLTNTPTWAPGKYGSSLQFASASSQYVTMGDTSSLMGSNSEGTVSLWFSRSSTSTNKPLFYFGDSGTDNNIFRLVFTTGNTLQILLKTSSDLYRGTVDLGATASNGSWNHLVFRVTTTGNALYYNGKQQTITYTTGSSSTASWFDDITGEDMLTIGSDRIATPTYFDGKIDEVKVYNYARTPGQIAYDYNRGLPVIAYRFDECQGTTLTDVTGNGNSGTITIDATGTQTSAGTCSTSSTAWGNGVTGRYNASLNFDGTDDYVNLDAIAANLPTTTSQVSLSVWFKLTSIAGNRTVIAYGGNDTSTGYWIIVSGTTGVPIFGVGNRSVGGTALTTNQWYHLVGTYDRSNIRLYINGRLAGTTAKTNDISTATTFRIGNEYNRAYWVSGQIDEVAVYNYALSESQVRQLMNQSSGVRFGPSTGSP